MFLNGMWFQDALQLRLCDDLQFKRAGSNLAGESVFVLQCGGWRKVLESVHHTATVAIGIEITVGTKSMRQAKRYS